MASTRAGLGRVVDRVEALRRRALLTEREGDSELARAAGAEAAAIFARLGAERSAAALGA